MKFAPVIRLFALCAAGIACGDDVSPTDSGAEDVRAIDVERPDSPNQPDAPSDASPPTDAGSWFDGGPPIEGCVSGIQPSGLLRICIPFPTGVRVHDVPPVEDSFGTANPPEDADFGEGGYAPGPGECSIATHDRYWVRARDGRVYRTWHPPAAIDVESGEPCNFGHEHGDDPRTSPLYHWAGGVPFGIVNRVAGLAGLARHEDHFGHKVVVQNMWEAALGNPPGPDDEPVRPAGFHCYWLSKVHQGTHSGDALGNNMHEYQNSVICDDGFARQPDADRPLNTGSMHHTENSVKTLTFWGQPSWFKACQGLDREDVVGGGGVEPPDSADTNREIKCAREGEGWTFKDFPMEIAGPNGYPDFAPRSAGIDELWKPWMLLVDRDGHTMFTSSAYYVVRNPIRLFNDGSLVAQRDVDGDGSVDNWIPTLEACLGFDEGERFGQCATLPEFPDSVPRTEWWRLPISPFRGTVRVIHPKTVFVGNRTERTEFCTDHLGQETSDDPAPDEGGFPTCPDGQIYQRLAATQNLWNEDSAAWGPDSIRDHISGSTVNMRGPTQGAGYGHEWVRFFDAPGIHAPN